MCPAAAQKWSRVQRSGYLRKRISRNESESKRHDGCHTKRCQFFHGERLLPDNTPHSGHVPRSHLRVSLHQDVSRSGGENLGTFMRAPEQLTKGVSRDSPTEPLCKAELIFYAPTRGNKVRQAEIFGDYACDFRRPDWAHRWTDWDSGKNPFLNLFLCRNHAKELGLMDGSKR
jgi:hypothetical protein